MSSWIPEVSLAIAEAGERLENLGFPAAAVGLPGHADVQHHDTGLALGHVVLDRRI